MCASGEVDVPPGGYFGFTAGCLLSMIFIFQLAIFVNCICLVFQIWFVLETGDLADEHKITSFKVKPINKQGLVIETILFYVLHLQFHLICFFF